MRFLKIILISLLLVSTANAFTAFDIRWGTDLNSNQRSNTLKRWAESMESRAGSSVAGTVDTYYVDSGVTTEGDGTSWTDARDTLNEAVALCTADNGDVIYVASGHAEDWSAADAADLDVAGITVIGCGVGEARPLFTITGAAGELVFGDASIWIENLRFRASVDSVVHIIEVEADADGFVIYNCEFMEPESASTVDEADDIIQVAAGANQGFIVGCTFYSAHAGANTAIDLTAGVIEDLTIMGNEIVGDWTEAGIYSDDIDLRHRYYGNTVQNTNSGNHGIWLNAATTGWSSGNHIITDTVAASYDPGSMQTSNTDVWSDSDTTDTLAVPIFTSETGVDIWAASQTAQIEAEAEDAIESDHLDHLAAASVADEIVDDSFFADLTSSTGDWSTFVKTTDSLQAISDKITALTGTGFRADCEVNAGGAGFFTSVGLAGFGDNFFNTGWYAICTYDAGDAGAAPEGEIRDIVDYVSTTGVFTIAPVTSAAITTGDKVKIVRVEELNRNDVTILGGSGDVWYVDAGKGGTPDVGDNGKTWELAFTTIALAIAGATASNGDVIYVAAGHTETFADAQLALDVAGVSIIGLGEGDLQPTIVYNHANASIDVTAANIYIENIKFETSITDVLIGIEVATTGDGLHLKDCVFVDDLGGTDDFLVAVDLVTVDDVILENCQFIQPGSDADAAIQSDTGVCDNLQIIDCRVKGDYDNAPIYSNQINTHGLIKGNVVQQERSTGYAIQVSAAMTGNLVGNKLHSDSYGTMLDPGSMMCIDNWGTDSIDQQAIRIPLSAETSDTAEEDDGSNLERLEYLQNKSEDILAMLRATGGNIGDVFYVDSVTGGTDGGTTWETAEATLATGYAKATANKGDIVFLAANHGETIAGATALASAGVSVIGIGYGDDRPLMTMTAAASSFDIGAADNLFENIVFYSTTINTTIGIDVADAGDGFILRNCEFTDTGGFEFDSCVDVKASADRVTIEDSRFIGGAAGTQAILATAGVCDRLTVRDNYIYGNYSAAVIFSDDIDTHVLVRDNIVTNLDTGAHCIEFSAAALGQCIDNYMAGDTYGAILDPGSMRCYGNLQTVGIDSGAIDVPLIAGKTYGLAVSVDEVTANILDIQNGGIIIHSIFAEVDVVIGNVATNCNLECDADDGGAWDCDLSTAVAITSDAAGTRWFMDDAGVGTNPPVLDPRKGGATEGTLSACPAMYVPEGLLIQAMDADPGGAGGDHITWYIRFSPLEDGVVVVPQ